MSSVSVIVPVYKVEPYLRRCADSILAQTYRDFELIFVDDGSPDNCGKICDEYARMDARIKVIHRKNGGLSAARNAGLDYVFAESAADWITFVDSDDWIAEDYLSQLVAGCEKNHVDISACGYVNVEGSVLQPLFKRPICDAFKCFTAEEYVALFNEDNVNYEWAYNLAWGKLYKRELLDSIRFPQGRLHEDLFTIHKLLHSGKMIALTQKPLYYYYRNLTGITASAWNVRRVDSVWGYREQMLYCEDCGYDVNFEIAARLYLTRAADAIYRLDKMKEYALRKELLSMMRCDYRRYRKKISLQYGRYANVYALVAPCKTFACRVAIAILERGLLAAAYKFAGRMLNRI